MTRPRAGSNLWAAGLAAVAASTVFACGRASPAKAPAEAPRAEAAAKERADEGEPSIEASDARAREKAERAPEKKAAERAPRAASDDGEDADEPRRPPAKTSDAPASPRPGTAPAPATSPAGGGAPSPRARSLASAVAHAARELDDAGSDCRAACRALGSMDRAAGRLCALARDARDDAPLCSDATRRLGAARGRVRSACGSCPGGPSVEPGAPVPSVP